MQDRKRLEQALSDAALTDSLTQLPNRAGIQQALDLLLAPVAGDHGVDPQHLGDLTAHGAHRVE